MTYEIVDDIALPESARRTRSRGPFATALDKLEVGQGFYFEDKRNLVSLYPAVSPKKFGGKKFKLGLEKAAEQEGELNKFAVKRVA